jgi:two-component system chemotaxis response regulator CheB
VRPGRIVIAPGDAHIHCLPLSDGSTCIRLSRAPAASGCTPSVDPMLASIAAVYGSRGLGVVLSGMGRDGAEGARALREAGGAVLAQDEASSVVWGMPGAVAAAGLADALLPPAAIGRLLAERRRP